MTIFRFPSDNTNSALLLDISAQHFGEHSGDYGADKEQADENSHQHISAVTSSQ